MPDIIDPQEVRTVEILKLHRYNFCSVRLAAQLAAVRPLASGWGDEFNVRYPSSPHAIKIYQPQSAYSMTF